MRQVILAAQAAGVDPDAIQRLVDEQDWEGLAQRTALARLRQANLTEDQIVVPPGQVLDLRPVLNFCSQLRMEFDAYKVRTEAALLELTSRLAAQDLLLSKSDDVFRSLASALDSEQSRLLSRLNVDAPLAPQPTLPTGDEIETHITAGPPVEAVVPPDPGGNENSSDGEGATTAPPSSPDTGGDQSVGGVQDGAPGTDQT